MEILIRHPSILQTLREELDVVLDDEEEVAPYDKIEHLPYLRAVLDEGLRALSAYIYRTAASDATRRCTDIRSMDSWRHQCFDDNLWCSSRFRDLPKLRRVSPWEVDGP